MELIIKFPGGSRVDAHVGPFTIHTDQLPDVSAPSPFALFLASIGTCAGYYVQEFCRQRTIPTHGMRIVQRTRSGPTGLVVGIDLEIELPPDFPEKYREAVVRAAELCTVKKHLEYPPTVGVTTAAGALEAEKRWKESSPVAAKKRTRDKVVAAAAGVALLGAAGVAIASSRRKKKSALAGD